MPVGTFDMPGTESGDAYARGFGLHMLCEVASGSGFVGGFVRRVAACVCVWEVCGVFSVSRRVD